MGFKSMQSKLIFLVAGLLVAAALIVGCLSVWQITRFGESGVEEIRAHMYAERQSKLKTLVDTAYTLMLKSGRPS